MSLATGLSRRGWGWGLLCTLPMLEEGGWGLLRTLPMLEEGGVGGLLRTHPMHCNSTSFLRVRVEANNNLALVSCDESRLESWAVGHSFSSTHI